MGKLDNWCHFWRLLSKLDDKQVVPYINAAIGQNIELKHIVGAFQKQFYYQWINSIISENPVLSAFNRISQNKALHTFAEKDTEQFEINKAKIRAELSSMRPSLDMLPSGSALAMLHNFGPLNRAGGERRLNVAVTRAKCNVQLVSSMHCTIRTLT